MLKMSTEPSETPHVLIPGPPGRLFFGNFWDIESRNTVDSLCRLTDVYGQCLVVGQAWHATERRD